MEKNKANVRTTVFQDEQLPGNSISNERKKSLIKLYTTVIFGGSAARILKHITPDCVVRGTSLFSLPLSDQKKKQSPQQSPSGVMNQNCTYLFFGSTKTVFLGIPQNFSH